jgi:arylsulfatase A-like enzyme
MKDFVELYPDLRTPGIVRELSTRGYQTANYSPFPWEPDYDAKATKALGFERLSFAHDSARLADTYDKPWMLKRSYDLDSLHLLESDVDGWLTRGERFVAVFAPQLGHDPWSDVSPDGHLKRILDRGRPLMALQDAYLGELLKLLESHHRLEKTLIVVTGDHGARTRLEDPDLQVGMIDDISFHVPLLLYAPQVLKSTVTIPWVTSHIDLSPSLLDLLAVERERSLEQGSPIWDSHLKDRTTFFFGRHYFSADGYYSRGQFFMWNYFFDSVYQNERQHFTSSNGIPRNSPTYYEVTRTIERMVNLQQRWVAVLGRGEGPPQSAAPGTR